MLTRTFHKAGEALDVSKCRVDDWIQLDDQRPRTIVSVEDTAIGLFYGATTAFVNHGSRRVYYHRDCSPMEYIHHLELQNEELRERLDITTGVLDRED